MRLRFKEFIEQENRVDEKVTLVQMRDNFKKVFPYSDFKNVRVVNSTTKGQDQLTMVCRGTVDSQHTSQTYTVLVQFHRKTLEEKWTIDCMAEVKCTCNAFRYNVAYPLFYNKNYAGTVPGNSKVPNKVQNKEKIPTFCKHIYGYLRYLIQRNIISLQ